MYTCIQNDSFVFLKMKQKQTSFGTSRPGGPGKPSGPFSPDFPWDKVEIKHLNKVQNMKSFSSWFMT